jgi:hypothetical protein
MRLPMPFTLLAALAACAAGALAQADPRDPVAANNGRLKLLLVDPGQSAAVVRIGSGPPRRVAAGEALPEAGWRVRSVLDDELLLEELEPVGPPRLLRFYRADTARRLGLDYPWLIIEPGSAVEPDEAPVLPRPPSADAQNVGPEGD